MAPFPLPIIVIALLVIAALGGYAAYLLLKLRSQKQQLAELETQNRQEREAQRERINKSLQVIAQAIQEDQVGFSEASLRIRGLMDALEVGADIREEFSIFFQLAEAIDHIPTHQSWKDLEKKERRRFEMEMAKIEADREEFIRDAAKRMLGRNF